MLNKFVAIILSCTQFAIAQAPPSPQTPTATFSSTTELVLVPVVVRSGKQHIAGLTKDDFTVLEDNIPQKIAFVQPASGSTSVKKVQRGDVFTNQLETSGGPPRLTVIAVDNMNTAFADQAAVVQEVTSFLMNRASTAEPTALIAFTIDGIRIIHDFTTDTASLLSSFAAAAGKKQKTAESPAGSTGKKETSASRKSDRVLGVLSLSEEDSLSNDSVCVQRLTRTLETLMVVAESMSGIPGRKTMLWITGGSPFSGFERPDSYLLPEASASSSSGGVTPPPNVAQARGAVLPQQGGNIEQHNKPCDLHNTDLLVLRPFYERVLKQLADSGVSIYPVDARGVVVGFPGADKQVDTVQLRRGTADVGGQQADIEYWNYQAMHNFADMTGARPCLRNNDFSDCMKAAVDDSGNYYLIGYYRDRSNDKEGWRSLKVKVDRPGAQVMARSGYFYKTVRESTKQERQEDIEFALASPFDFPGLPFSVSVKQLPDANPKLRTLQLHYFVPPSSLARESSANRRMSLEIVAAASQKQGKDLDTFAKSLEGEFKPDEPSSVINTGLRYDEVLHVPPGDLTLHMIVRDNMTGRIGSIVIPYSVQ